MKHQIKTKRIINAYYKVYNTLGYGFKGYNLCQGCEPLAGLGCRKKQQIQK